MTRTKVLSLLFICAFLLVLAGCSCQRSVIVPQDAPQAVGPYSQGIAAGGFIYTSGQLPLNPATNTMPDGIEAQARQSLDNVKAVVEAGGSNLDKVLKVTIFLKDMNDFAKVNEIYAAYFTGEAPARSCVQVARVPRDALIEIEAVAVK